MRGSIIDLASQFAQVPVLGGGGEAQGGQDRIVPRRVRGFGRNMHSARRRYHPLRRQGCKTYHPVRVKGGKSRMGKECLFATWPTGSLPVLAAWLVSNFIVAIGNYGAGNVRCQVPVPGTCLRRKLRALGLPNIYLVNEYRTSKTCPLCLQMSMQNFRLCQNPRPQRPGQRKLTLPARYLRSL